MQGMKGLVITDHNNFMHFEESTRAAQEEGLMTCQGIEITASFQQSDIHVLGYAVQFDTSVFRRVFEKMAQGYNERSQAIVEKVVQRGLAELDFDTLKQSSRTGYVSKVNIAYAIAEQRNILITEALALVERGGPAYVPYGAWVITPEEAVDLIIHAGGKPVFAHPGDLFLKRSSLPIEERWPMFEQLVGHLAKRGLRGIETCYPTHSIEMKERLHVIAERFGLIETGGSDWHGEQFKPDRLLGMGGVTSTVFEALLSW